jgi:hypothetical protein
LENPGVSLQFTEANKTNFNGKSTAQLYHNNPFELDGSAKNVVPEFWDCERAHARSSPQIQNVSMKNPNELKTAYNSYYGIRYHRHPWTQQCD